jgi:hypothetical protein
MRKLSALAAIPLFAGFICGQAERTQTETTTTTTWNGTLIDEGCRTTKTQRKETKTEENTTTRTETNREVTECPVTTTSKSFGLMTSDGKYVHFDEASNTRIAEMLKTNKEWTTFIGEHKPVSVRVVGTRNGEVVVIKEIR